MALRLFSHVLAAAETVSKRVRHDCEPMTASEDFAKFLQHVPGTFLFIGNGENSQPLHSLTYDLNDVALAHGAQVFTAMIRNRLGGS